MDRKKQIQGLNKDALQQYMEDFGIDFPYKNEVVNTALFLSRRSQCRAVYNKI